MMSDLHQTARQWFTIKIVNGEVPSTVVGHGELDGLNYYEVTIDDVDYWLTDIGLFTPPPNL